jgi:hypothetical protein
MGQYKTKRIIDKKPPPRTVIVDETGKVINKNPTKDELKGLEEEIYSRVHTKRKESYNRTNTCDNIIPVGFSWRRCEEKLVKGKVRRCRDKEGNETGRWICKKCWQKYDPNSQNNIQKMITDRRTGNQNPNHTNVFGDNVLELACILYGWEDLNKRYDNYKSPIDCYDPKTGLYHQVRGKSLGIICRYVTTKGEEMCYEGWMFGNLEREWGKIFEDMVCFCFSEDGKLVERIYIMSKKEIMIMKGIGIYKNPSKGNYQFEKYRITDEYKLKKANDIWKKIIYGL